MINDIQFHKINIDDRNKIINYQINDIPTICGHNFVNLFIWKEANDIEIAEISDSIIISSAKCDCRYFYFPIGNSNKKMVINELFNEKHRYCKKLKFIGITEKQKEFLESMFPHKFTFTPQVESFDYIYEVGQLAELKGKHLRTKKQFIRRFKENNNWNWEYINKENISQCFDIENLWLQKNVSKTGNYINYEMIALENALQNFSLLELTGILLKVDGKVIAFAIGSRLNNETIDCHFEKADKNIIGSYETIRWLFTSNCCKSYKFLNCEEDLGIDSLRKSKLSYHPIDILKQFIAEEI